MKENLSNSIIQLKSYKLAESYLERIIQIRADQQRSIEKLRDIIENKIQNIERLDRHSFRSIYAHVMGNRKIKLNLYKQQYLDYTLQYNELYKSIETLGYEIKVLKEKASNLPNVKENFKNIIRNVESQIPSHALEEYRIILKKLDSKIGLSQEIEEAIEEGVKLNKKYNLALRFIIAKAKEIYNINKETDTMLRYDISKIDKYQGLMIRIQHSMVKFESEINDVYRAISKDNFLRESSSSNFFNDYRNNLLADLDGQFKS